MAIKRLHKLNKSVLYFLFVFFLFFPVMVDADYQTNLLPGEYLMVGSNQIDIGSWSVPIVYDWNSDMKKDLLVGQNHGDHGYVSYYQNIGSDPSPVFDINSSTYLQSCTSSCSSLDVIAWG